MYMQILPFNDLVPDREIASAFLAVVSSSRFTDLQTKLHVFFQYLCPAQFLTQVSVVRRYFLISSNCFGIAKKSYSIPNSSQCSAQFYDYFRFMIYTFSFIQFQDSCKKSKIDVENYIAHKRYSSGRNTWRSANLFTFLKSSHDSSPETRTCRNGVC